MLLLEQRGTRGTGTDPSGGIKNLNSLAKNPESFAQEKPKRFGKEHSSLKFEKNSPISIHRKHLILVRNDSFYLKVLYQVVESLRFQKPSLVSRNSCPIKAFNSVPVFHSYRVVSQLDNQFHSVSHRLPLQCLLRDQRPPPNITAMWGEKKTESHKKEGIKRSWIFNRGRKSSNNYFGWQSF